VLLLSYAKSMKNLERRESMRHKDKGDIIGGVLIIMIGVFAAIYSQRYDLGRLGQMGPGFFPTVLGIGLFALGVLITIPALFRYGPEVKVNWKGSFWVLLSIFAFAITLENLGLPLATIVAVLAATSASTLRWRSRLYVGISLAVITYVVFILGLRLYIPVWPRMALM